MNNAQHHILSCQNKTCSVKQSIADISTFIYYNLKLLHSMIIHYGYNNCYFGTQKTHKIMTQINLPKMWKRLINSQSLDLWGDANNYGPLYSSWWLLNGNDDNFHKTSMLHCCTFSVFKNVGWHLNKAK